MSPQSSSPSPQRIAQFWNRVHRSDGCWEWQGYRLPSGYGHLSWLGRSHAAHRLAWELTNGPIPEGLCVCHRCDNPSCCRPEHLFLGTLKDNITDRHAKGRTARGTAIGKAKLTEEIVAAMRADYAAGMSKQAIASTYQVPYIRVHQIVLGKEWRWVGG